MEFEWDAAKGASNLAKHGVRFELALEFDWENAAVYSDTRFDYGEARFLAIGADSSGRMYAIIYTEREDRFRVISIRRANSKEVSQWQEHRSK